jgi:hypothetical protein
VKPYRVKEIDAIRDRLKNIKDDEQFLAALETAGVSQSELLAYTKAKKKSQ